MGKYSTTKNRKTNKRLLVYITFVLLIQYLVFSETDNIDNKIETISISEYFNITITLSKHLNITKPKNNKISLANPSNDIDIVESSFNEKTTDIIYNAKIKFNSIGEKKIIWKLNNSVLSDNTVYLNVVPPILSKESQFIWNIFTNKELITIPDEILQGESYVIVISGFFSKELSKNTIQSIECNANNTAILEKINIPLPKYLQNNTPIAAFKWTPLYTGTVSLPSAKIYFSDSQNNKSEFCVVNDIDLVVFNFIKKNQPNTIYNLSPLTIQKITSPPKSNSNTNITTSELKLHKHNVKQLYILQNKLRNNIIDLSSNKKIYELERTLNIKNNIKVFRKKSVMYVLILSYMILIISIIISKFKTHNFYISIIIMIICLSISIYYFINATKQYGVIYSSEKTQISIKTIPEFNSAYKHILKIGETVKIQKQVNEWIFIKDQHGFVGWIHKDNILICK